MQVNHPILDYTFAVQYNPNCPSPWLVRLAGKSAVVDLKPYQFCAKEDLTGDILGFGKSFAEAADLALRKRTEEMEALERKVAQL